MADATRCRGWCRYAVPCKNRTTNANGLCAHHQHQERVLDNEAATDALREAAVKDGAKPCRNPDCDDLSHNFDLMVHV